MKEICLCNKYIHLKILRHKENSINIRFLNKNKYVKKKIKHTFH